MKTTEEKIDRSRLKLLGALASAGAAGACSNTNTDDPLGGLKTGLTRTGKTKEQLADDERVNKIRIEREAKRVIIPWDSSKADSEREEWKRLNGGEGESGGGGSH